MPQTSDLNALIEQLPHGDGFRFVDEIESLQAGDVGHGIWRVSGDEPFFAGHFPGKPIVPGVLLGEALAQMSGLVALADERSENHHSGALAQIDLRLKRPVAPPAEIHLHATMTRHVRVLTHFDVHATCDGQVVARGSLTIASVNGGAS